jgi:hypothetical protein
MLISEVICGYTKSSAKPLPIPKPKKSKAQTKIKPKPKPFNQTKPLNLS